MTALRSRTHRNDHFVALVPFRAAFVETAAASHFVALQGSLVFSLQKTHYGLRCGDLQGPGHLLDNIHLVGLVIRRTSVLAGIC